MWKKLDTARFFQKNLNLLIHSQSLIFMNPDYYDVTIPKCTFINHIDDLHSSVYLGDLLNIWANQEMLLTCKECGKGKVHGFYYHYSYLKQLRDGKSIRTTEFHGVCNMCRRYIAYVLEGEERFSLPPIRYSRIRLRHMNRKGNLTADINPLTPEQLIVVLGGSDLTITEPVIYRHGNLSTEEKIKIRNEIYSYYFLKHVGFCGHMIYQHKTPEEKEAYAQQSIATAINEGFEI